MHFIEWKCINFDKDFTEVCSQGSNSPISQRFFLQRWAARTPQISSWVITTHCRLYNNISQILLQYKTWRYYSKFDFTKSLGVCCRCVKLPQCGYMEHGLKDTVFYVQKHTNTLHSCHNFPAGSRQAARGACICETSLLTITHHWFK